MVNYFSIFREAIWWRESLPVESQAPWNLNLLLSGETHPWNCWTTGHFENLKPAETFPAFPMKYGSKTCKIVPRAPIQRWKNWGSPGDDQGEKTLGTLSAFSPAKMGFKQSDFRVIGKKPMNWGVFKYIKYLASHCILKSNQSWSLFQVGPAPKPPVLKIPLWVLAPEFGYIIDIATIS